MRVRVLGSAAGGAFPQWNCSCSNCRNLRQGHFAGTARSQNQLAVSADGQSWILLNASPDLRCQIGSFPPLHPQPSPVRNSPIAAIVLPSAEVDAALGLLLLREFLPLTVYATSAVRRILTEDNSMFGVLRRIPHHVNWIDMVPSQPIALGNSSIECVPMTTECNYPGFVPPERALQLDPEQAVLGFILKQGPHSVAYFPGVGHVSEAWIEQAKSCDVLFFDGTFWSDDELIRVHGTGKPARALGHQPVSDTLRTFKCGRARKIFIHVNNTNPMLNEASPEYRAVLDAGWEVAFDGMELEL